MKHHNYSSYSNEGVDIV